MRSLRLLCVLACVLPCLLWAGGCTVEKPAAPSFDTNVYVPMGEQSTTGLDLMHDSEYIEGDSTGDGPLTFVMKGTVHAFEVGSALDVEAPGSGFELTLASVAVQSPTAVDVSFPFTTLYLDALPPDHIVPPFTIAGARVETPAQDSFSWLRLDSGQLQIEIANGLGVDLGRDGGEPFWIRVVDRFDGNLVKEVHLGEVLHSGSTATITARLDGASFHNILDVEIWGESPGSGDSPVLVGPQSLLSLRLSFSSLTADSAVARVPVQRATVSRSVPLGGGIHLREGAIQEGRLTLHLRNSLPLSATARLVLPDVRREGAEGAMVEQIIQLPAAGDSGPAPVSVVVELGRTTVTAPAGTTSLDSLRYDVQVESEAATGMVPVGIHQKASGRFEPAVMRFTRVQGDFDRKRVTVTPTDTAFEPPEGIEDLDFQQASLVLEVVSTIGLSSEATIAVQATSEAGGPPVTLNLHFPVPAASSPGTPVVTRATADETNSNILELIRSRPRRLTLGGEIFVGGGGQTGTIRRSDSVSGTYALTAPLRITIGRVSHRADPFGTTLSKDDQDRIRENILSAAAVGSVENHFPAGLTAHLVFAAREEDLAAHPDVVLDSIQVAPGRVDPVSGRVVSSVSSAFEIQMSPEQIAFFARDEFYGQVIFTMQGPDARAIVEMTALDYVNFRGMLQFRMRVQP
jgi:hypothetical protein